MARRFRIVKKKVTRMGVMMFEREELAAGPAQFVVTLNAPTECPRRFARNSRIELHHQLTDEMMPFDHERNREYFRIFIIISEGSQCFE